METHEERIRKQLDEVRDLVDTRLNGARTGGTAWEVYDPSQLDKKQEGTSGLFKVEVMPGKGKKPTGGFWDRKFGAYYIGAGKHAKFIKDSGRFFDFHLGFVFGAGQKTRERFAGQVLGILEEVASKKPEDYFVLKRGEFPLPGNAEKEWAYHNILKRFYHAPGKVAYSTDEIVGELLWLIQQSYSRFAALE